METTDGTRDDGWTTVRCWGCRGHGQVADYGHLGLDFYGAKDCDVCWGNGRLWFHEPSYTYAVYPGGPLRGRKPRAA